MLAGAATASRVGLENVILLRHNTPKRRGHQVIPSKIQVKLENSELWRNNP